MVRCDEITITLTARRTALETPVRRSQPSPLRETDRPVESPGDLVSSDDVVGEPPDVASTERPAAASTPIEVELDELPAAPATATHRGHGIARRSARAALRKQRSRPGNSLQTASPELPDLHGDGPGDRMPLSQLQRITAKHLDRSWKTIPQVTQQAQIDVTELEFQRHAHNRADRDGCTASMTAVMIKAAALALEVHPHLNASLDTEQGELILKDDVNVGVVLDLPEGLVMPVVRNAHTLCLDEIEQQLRRLILKARTGTLELEDLRGATFTIFDRASDGAAGGRHDCVHDLGFTPIVPWPQVAILGASPSRQQLVLIDDRPQARLMLPLSISYDQRVMNGSDATRFLGCFCEVLHQPFELLCAA